MSDLKCFIPVSGQYDNIGDVMHRRVLLRWLQQCGELHVYVGNLPPGFVEALEISTKFTPYKSRLIWMMAVLRSIGARSAFCFVSGEMSMSGRRLLMEAGLFPLLCLHRRFGGKVLRIGVAMRTTSELSLPSMWFKVLRTSSKVFWRTRESQAWARSGSVIPDLAFGDSYKTETCAEKRSVLAISMRHDRAFPTDEWFEGIRYFASEHDLQVTVVSQVRMDNPRTEQIALRFGTCPVIWPSDLPHSRQEERLRRIYGKSRMIISDRLHALIAGCNWGATPASVLTEYASKIDQHFSVLNIPGFSLPRNSDGVQVRRYLCEMLAKEETFKRACSSARSTLQGVENEVIEYLRHG